MKFYCKVIEWVVKAVVVLLLPGVLYSPGAGPGPGGPPQPAQQSKRLQQTQAQVDEVYFICFFKFMSVLLESSMLMNFIFYILNDLKALTIRMKVCEQRIKHVLLIVNNQ